jgi:LysR family transcriptional regulator, transcriptional activator of the cysJI operon
MDTRQLASFCTVVEQQSFSLAAEQLGVTQPAVSLQIRSLEKRLGRQLLDRSGRRVEPTEAGLRLYRSAQRMLALEEQLLDEIADAGDGELAGTLEIGASTGPGGSVVPLLLCEFQRANPGLRISLTVSDTQTIVDQVAARELALGIVGAARRHRGITFEPFLRDEVVLACPPDHRFAGRTISLDELRTEPQIVMQEGAGVRQVIEDALRSDGLRLRDLDVKLELGLQESVKSAVAAGYGITFISRSAIEAELSTGAIATARVEGLEPAREISLATATGRTMPRTAAAFLEFARGRLP